MSPLHTALKDSPYLLACLHTFWKCSWVNSDVAFRGQTVFGEGFPVPSRLLPGTSMFRVLFKHPSVLSAFSLTSGDRV